jgi:hypothetical protein
LSDFVNKRLDRLILSTTFGDSSQALLNGLAKSFFDKADAFETEAVNLVNKLVLVLSLFVMTALSCCL